MFQNEMRRGEGEGEESEGGRGRKSLGRLGQVD